MLPLLLLPSVLAAPTVVLPLTLADLPFQVEAGFNPSFQQSLDLAWDTDRLTSWGIEAASARVFPRRPEWHRFSMSFLSGLAVLPYLYADLWVHEEWHRAVLGQYGISSRNGAYYPSAWSNGAVSVDHVSDADLSWLKANHPADTVRLMEAGMEAERALTLRIGDDLFSRSSLDSRVYRDASVMEIAAWYAEISIANYRWTCISRAGDEMTRAETARAVVEADRDFAGLDCTAWIYDMRRPDAAFEDRGPHPYGEGVDRYIAPSDLTDDERDYLRRQAWMALVDLANPHLVGIHAFALGTEGDRVVALASHTQTPWGEDLALHGNLVHRGREWRFDLHNGIAGVGWFPGLAAAALARPLPSTPLRASGGADLWLQPEDLRWDAARRRPGGRVWAGLTWSAAPHLNVDLEVEGKTEGWVLGNVALGPAVQGRAGVTWIPR